MTERLSFDLDDLDDDLNDADLLSLNNGSIGYPEQGEIEAPLTLESILNEADDDLENDEIIKTLTESLTIFHNERKNTLSNKSSRSGSSSLANNSLNQQSNEVGNGLFEKNGIVCKQVTLKQISAQLVNAIERSDAGLPTALTIDQLIAVGTSRGLVLLFDSLQVLKLYITTEYKDAISALSLNNKCDRLLVGNALGHIFMFDTTNGKCLRQITDAHPYGNAILNLKFTDDLKLACFSDSGGSVFMLEFKRVMGVRGADSTCLFSGSRGEVCHIEPLKFEKYAENFLGKLDTKNSPTNSSAIKKSLDNVNSLFKKYLLLAMVSFTKLFVITLRPRLNVLFTFPINGNSKYLPILAWQFVVVQQTKLQSQEKRYVSPILACARESTIHYFQIDYSQIDSNEAPNGSGGGANRRSYTSLDDPNSIFKFIQLQKNEFKFKIYNFAWLNAKTLAILDETEKLHICDVRSGLELQILSNLSDNVQLVYNSSFFKSLATGGYVSEALAYAGENACYQTIQSHLGQLFMLGSRSIVVFSIQNWSARIDDFVNENNLELALDLALAMYKGETKALIGLPVDNDLRKEKIVDKIIDVLDLFVNTAIKQDCPPLGKLEMLEKHYRNKSRKIVNVCMMINREDILFDNLYALITCDSVFECQFFESLEEYVLLNRLRKIPPLILKNFIEYYSKSAELLEKLEKCIPYFSIESIDLHNLIQLCREQHLLDSFIYLHNQAFEDYVTPFEEIVTMMEPVMFLTYETAKAHLRQAELKSLNQKPNFKLTTYGNKLLVYLHCCLCGQAYPYGRILDDQLSDRVRRTTFDYLISKRNKLIDKLLTREKETRLNGESPIAKYLDEFLDENSMAGAYPILRILLNFDTLDFLNVISMTFNEASFEAVIGLEKKQQLIDILINLCFHDSSSSSHFTLSSQINGHLFTFLARQIANKNNNIQVDNSMFSQIIEYLCNREENERMEEREQTMLNLLETSNVQLSDRFDFERILNLALSARYFRVCEILYELRGEYYEIVDCYLSHENSLQRQKEVFQVVRKLLDTLYESFGDEESRSRSRTSSLRKRVNTASVEAKDVQLKKLQDKLCRQETIKQMISLDACETVYLLWIEMNLDIKFLIKNISNFSKKKNDAKQQQKRSKNVDYDTRSIDSSFSLDMSLIDEQETDFDSNNLLFKFMKGLFELAELLKIDRKYINYMSQFRAEYCELYIDLMCRFEPAKLLHTLQTTLSDYSFRVEECLRICRERRVWDGAAYMLEKSGQIEAAFTLNLEKLTALLKELRKMLENENQVEFEQRKTSVNNMLVTMVQFCQRNSLSLEDSVKEKIWFSLFDEIMQSIRSLVFSSSNSSNNESIGVKIDDTIVKHRLENTRDFLKRIGSYLINSMVGYLSLTVIIDRIVCDPLYGASNFGDIKDLILKMIETCTYEQVLLAKTSTLVCKDVHLNMQIFKRYSSKSFSPHSHFCQYCTRPLDLREKTGTGSSASSANFNQSPNTSLSTTDTNKYPEFLFDTSTLKNESDSKMAISIFHCGHSFHQSCLEIAQSNSVCPICKNLSNQHQQQQNKNKLQKSKYSNNKLSSRLENEFKVDENGGESLLAATSASSSSPQTSSIPTSHTSLSQSQIAALKAIRSRTMSSFIESGNVFKPLSSKTSNLLEKQSKLKLAPANLAKFI